MSVIISMFENAFGTDPVDTDLDNILNDIQSSRWKSTIEHLRHLLESEPDQYEREKKRLPAFTMSARCVDRKTSSTHSGLLQIDRKRQGECILFNRVEAVKMGA